jgi:hypothetical protein
LNSSVFIEANSIHEVFGVQEVVGSNPASPTCWQNGLSRLLATSRFLLQYSAGFKGHRFWKVETACCRKLLAAKILPSSNPVASFAKNNKRFLPLGLASQSLFDGLPNNRWASLRDSLACESAVYFTRFKGGAVQVPSSASALGR